MIDLGPQCAIENVCVAQRSVPAAAAAAAAHENDKQKISLDCSVVSRSSSTMLMPSMPHFIAIFFQQTSTIHLLINEPHAYSHKNPMHPHEYEL